MASKTNKIIGIVISLFLLGVLLPIGIDEITSVDLTDKVVSSSGSDTTDYEAGQYLYNTQQINITVEYNHSVYLLNLTVEIAGVQCDTDSTANATLNVVYNATSHANHTILVENLGVSSEIDFTYTIEITTFIDSDNEELIETLVGVIIPIFVVVGIIIWFVKRKQEQ